MGTIFLSFANLKHPQGYELVKKLISYVLNIFTIYNKNISFNLFQIKADFGIIFPDKHDDLFQKKWTEFSQKIIKLVRGKKRTSIQIFIIILKIINQ